MKKRVEETIEFVHDYWWYCQRGRYGRMSVLEGQEYRRLVSAYDSLAEAKSAHPVATIERGRLVDKWELPLNPPSWFDPADAGEHWGEDY